MVLYKGIGNKMSFEKRLENAIEKLKDKELNDLNGKKYCFSEYELKNEFSHEDITYKYSTTDQIFFNGEFILFAHEKILII